MSETSPRECLECFADAWARHDVGGLLELMTEDAVYAASVGPEPGRTFRGHAESAGDGAPYREYGIDLWRFRDGKICLKDAYRKTRG
ncbi:nuclear transport factor 2 family protein [Nonomuraea sp. GTA35]|uniref:nuclear transport factor 2 family protein n=1 Tax=Nonomuraea sp. GTA35 TaxID=1676746 RepID=UPI0035C25DBA